MTKSIHYCHFTFQTHKNSYNKHTQENILETCGPQKFNLALKVFQLGAAWPPKKKVKF